MAHKMPANYMDGFNFFCSLNCQIEIGNAFIRRELAYKPKMQEHQGLCLLFSSDEWLITVDILILFGVEQRHEYSKLNVFRNGLLLEG